MQLQLTDSISKLPFVGPTYEKKLKKLDISTVFDLLHHVPHRYIDFSKFTKIKDIKTNELVSVFAEITSIINQPTKSGKLMQLGTISDETGKINIIWFNQYYLTKTLFKGTKLVISGKASWFNRKLAFFTPQYEIILPAGRQGIKTIHTGKIVGVYPSTAGLSNKWLKARIKYAIDKVNIDEFINLKLIKKNNLLTFPEALYKIHFPESLGEAKMAHDRLALNEFYNLLIKAQARKREFQKVKSFTFKVDQNKIDKFIKSLPFTLTNSQQVVIKEIINDLKRDVPMNRLVQGDVGSGKTIVAAISGLISYLNGYQTIFLAPTQILANQHFNTIKQLFSNSVPEIRIELVTAETKKIKKSDIYVGTHALLNKVKLFEKVGLVVIDEQHKFGVNQIDFLDNQNPNRLVMTATPIPRTIAQTLFSDMDLSIINEIPKGRITIKTWLVPNEKRSGAYNWIREQISNTNCQVFIVCPLVEDSGSETLKDIKSVKSEYIKLKSIFKKFNLGLLHGKMKDKDKHKALIDFKGGKTDILVTTPVVEVGIDIPNATIMMIEGADRFGLAALHQLRGRVGRGDKQSYCLLFTDNTSEKATDRLSALTKTHSGFELAELDFKLRGAGDILGTKQSGFGNLKIADWSDTKLIKLASQFVSNL